MTSTASTPDEMKRPWNGKLGHADDTHEDMERWMRWMCMKQVAVNKMDAGTVFELYRVACWLADGKYNMAEEPSW